MPDIDLNLIISIAQIAVSVILIVLVLLQERGGDAGGLFGGAGGGFYQARRGLERTIFIATVVFVIVFALLALANLFIK